MPSIRSELSIDYTHEGMIAASPDYGIVPGSILAVFVFQSFKCRARDVLVVVTFGIAAVVIWCALYPSLHSLVVSRAVGGLLWAQGQ